MIIKPIREMSHLVLDMDITYLETFAGYKGDTVLKVVYDKKEVRDEIEFLAKKKKLYVKSDFELNGQYSGKFNTFVAYSDPDIYQLKG